MPSVIRWYSQSKTEEPMNEFKPPASQDELKRRAADISIDGARAVINSLKKRKAAAIAPLDQEIKFYQDVIKLKENEV